MIVLHLLLNSLLQGEPIITSMYITYFLSKLSFNLINLIFSFLERIVLHKKRVIFIWYYRHKRTWLEWICQSKNRLIYFIINVYLFLIILEMNFRLLHNRSSHLILRLYLSIESIIIIIFIWYRLTSHQSFFSFKLFNPS